ncbi:hypothetical protein MSAN_00553200 [Mycena sanguinolenta]|uniref:Uncharacterized protein n=1 Tax=Mycena sanguinolenta TaxID=230812 RepID=A0A8H7DJC2_9AGAR|nr:hypothetical protein MSAN_00553200 [Mycena sanguinolenta]
MDALTVATSPAILRDSFVLKLLATLDQPPHRPHHSQPRRVARSPVGSHTVPAKSNQRVAVYRPQPSIETERPPAGSRAAACTPEHGQLSKSSPHPSLAPFSWSDCAPPASHAPLAAIAVSTSNSSTHAR